MDISFMAEVTQPSSEEMIVSSINETQSIDHPVGKIKIEIKKLKLTSTHIF